MAAHGLYVTPITYIPYREAPPFTDHIAPLLHKRNAFSDERELRLLKFDVGHYNALVSKDASVSELPKHIFLDWVLRDVIEEITVGRVPGSGVTRGEAPRLPAWAGPVSLRLQAG